jgi:predicted NBD/HSP70 family sugar kinase
MGHFAVGIDLGGTKVEACLVDETRRIIARRRRPSEPALGREKVVGNILELVAETAGAARYEAVGMGTPGTYSAADDIMYGAPHTPLYEKPGLVSLLRAKLAVPLVIENDANCLALAPDRIFERYEAGDPRARRVFDDSVRIMGELFANCVNALDLEAIVLGGGVSNIPLWSEKVPAVMTGALFGTPGRTIPILKAVLGDSAGVLGAAYLALREMGLMEF